MKFEDIDEDDVSFEARLSRLVLCDEERYGRWLEAATVHPCPVHDKVWVGVAFAEDEDMTDAVGYLRKDIALYFGRYLGNSVFPVGDVCDFFCGIDLEMRRYIKENFDGMEVMFAAGGHPDEEEAVPEADRQIWGWYGGCGYCLTLPLPLTDAAFNAAADRISKWFRYPHIARKCVRSYRYLNWF